jgi:hypothetical protein
LSPGDKVLLFKLQISQKCLLIPAILAPFSRVSGLSCAIDWN